MRTLSITTWNVLHYVHAVNWSEQVLSDWLDERARIEGITRIVARQLQSGCDAVCLQEVSGDQLAGLRAALPSMSATATLFHHALPRVPRWKVDRDPGAFALSDATEQLVTIVAAPGARVVRSQTFANDAGKALLAVALADGTVVVNTHVTWRETGRSQIASVAEVARAALGVTIVVGDFNAPLEDVRAAFGEEAAYADVSQQALRTRSGSQGAQGRDIDHVIVFGGAIDEVRVLDAETLSDHNLLVASIRAGAQ